MRPDGPGDAGMEYGHAWTDPDPTFLDANRVYECREPECRIRQINNHPVHHVRRTVTYGEWQPSRERG